MYVCGPFPSVLDLLACTYYVFSLSLHPAHYARSCPWPSTSDICRWFRPFFAVPVARSFKVKVLMPASDAFGQLSASQPKRKTNVMILDTKHRNYLKRQSRNLLSTPNSKLTRSKHVFVGGKGKGRIF